MADAGSLVSRVVAQATGELHYWRLSVFQAAMLLLIAVWPWLVQWLHPTAEATSGLAFLPIIVFVPVGYLVGGSQTWWPGGYQVGFSVAVFLQAYVCLACWRIRRAHRESKVRA
jgi:hypothetical protein